MKKFYRSRKDKMIAGVAGGVAEYFTIDPVLARLIMFGLVFSGAFFIVYLVAWIVVPCAPEEA